MIKFLNNIRSAENLISTKRKTINTIALLFLGIALGTFSKFMDVHQAELPSILMEIDGALDITNFLGRFAIWVLIALCISIYSNSAIRASFNVFAFFIGMVTSYYLYSYYIAGFFPRNYAMIWFGFTAVSPLLAFVCWYAKGKSKLAFILSVLILAVLFNMCFVYGYWYFSSRSVLEVIVFITGAMVLKRETLRDFVLMVTISIILAFFLNIVIPFHFG
ncbi:hypothetical protein [Helcococcus sueciensis]|uniref:hypothetical protein n=1 Tax=Helcococcus sueciensis TaxID=241555 RepID=UPI00041200D6|nr:hypothetical protein [Helcococcus sueciensis]